MVIFNMKKSFIPALLLLFNSLAVYAQYDVTPKEQASQPFWTFSDMALTGKEYFYAGEGVPEQRVGEVEFSYDTQGRLIKKETTVRNVEGKVLNNNFFSFSVPADAVYKQIEIEDENKQELVEYYIDADGQKHVLLDFTATYYNGILIETSYRVADANGNMVDRSKVESILDDQGRPLEVTEYARKIITDPVSGKQVAALCPISKTEFVYGSGSVVTKTLSSYKFDDKNNGYWDYSYRKTEGLSADSVNVYEYMVFDTQDSIWMGKEKKDSYSHILDDRKQDMSSTWSWDEKKNDWVLDEMVVCNDYYNGLEAIQYIRYDSIKSMTYPYKIQEYTYSGDTVRSLYVELDEPDSLSQLSNLTPLINHSERIDYVDYTWAELGLDEKDVNDEASVPRKYEAKYKLVSTDVNSMKWEYESKKEYEYELIPQSNKVRLLHRRAYKWNGTSWIQQEERINRYDELGNLVLFEKYSDWDDEAGIWKKGDKIERTFTDTGTIIGQVEYILKDGAWVGDSKSWKEFDANGHPSSLTFYSYDKDWYAIQKVECRYDESGELLDNYFYYMVDGELLLMEKFETIYEDGRAVAKADSMLVSVYDSDSNKVWKWEPSRYFELSEDSITGGTTQVTKLWNGDEWETYSKKTEAKDSVGNITYYESYEMNTETNEWLGDKKYEQSFDMNGNKTLDIVYGWNDIAGTWGTKKVKEYDKYGNLIIESSYETDTLGNWIGIKKAGDYYNVDEDITYKVSYTWDSDRKDWRGVIKRETRDSMGNRLEVLYLWNDTDWCWNGYIKAVEETNEQKNQSITCFYLWDLISSDWIPNDRQTEEYLLRSDDNVDFNMLSYEVYDAKNQSWTVHDLFKSVFKYTVSTVVDDVAVNFNVSMFDGSVTVTAGERDVIRIYETSGADIASGVGEVSANVAPGIYIVSINGKSCKIYVR